MSELIKVCGYVYPEHKKWMDEQLRSFNFSDWIRTKIEEEISKDEPGSD